MEVHVKDEFGQSAASLRDGGSLTVKCTEDSAPDPIRFAVLNEDPSGGWEKIWEWNMTTEGINLRVTNQAGNETFFPGKLFLP